MNTPSEQEEVEGKPIDWQQEESPLFALKKMAGFLVLVAVGLLVSHYTPHGGKFTVESIAKFGESLGHWGPIFILVAGILTPLIFMPRWPLAFLGGLLYGLLWGTLLATFSSTLGAWLHYSLTKTLLSPMSQRIIKRYRLERFVVPKNKEFLAIFLMRAFPLSSFVVTNVIAGALRMDRWTFLFASFLGMIPSSLMYAAGGKLLKKPSGHFYIVAAICLVAILIGSAFAAKRIHSWQGSNGKA